MIPDCVLFVISQPYLNARRQAALAQGLVENAPIKAAFIRLEGLGENLPGALDRLAAEGHRRILVQPVGLPFSDSLQAWLPGVLAHWRDHCGGDIEITLGVDQIEDADTLAGIARRAVEGAHEAQPITGVKPSLGKRGWRDVPHFSHHLLVCSGPRCHYRDAPSLRVALADAVARAGLDKACRITQTGCLYPCNQGPIVAHYPAGRWYRLETEGDVHRFVYEVLACGGAADDLVIHAMDHARSMVSTPAQAESDLRQTTIGK